ncbi:SAM-dependent DNA methyltransferase, partial [Lactococcus cremoris]|nr:SAM-dependent DNA methyltransferase [Lactococcus cremoris]
DYNLNIPRYVDTFEEEESIDLADIQGQIDEVDAEIAKANQTLANYFKELGVLK